jgi:predicted peptidase
MDRIYTGGFSKAGGAAWQAVILYPDFFAAILPSSATMPDMSQIPMIASKDVGVWMFNGGPQDIIKPDHQWGAAVIEKEMTAAGGKPRSTRYEKLGHHEAWVSDSLTDPSAHDFTEVREWLFAQRKKHTAKPR